jgi:succinyl-CoA:acetate CoA-transferase
MPTATQNSTRVLNSSLAHKIMTAEEAASLIQSGDQVGMSGFTGSGYPKTVPVELARRIAEANFRGQKFQVSVFTGASTGPELDGALAIAGDIHLRFPINRIPRHASALMPAKWTTWTSISAMLPSSSSMDSSGS